MENQFSTQNIQEYLAQSAETVNTRLNALFATDSVTLEQNKWPERLLNAMRHGVLNGGKRLRPILVLEATKLFAHETGGEQQKQLDMALDCATALELVHCYSLIHDDLPAMDNDDWRRGKPTVHKAYDDATAILAGNALLTLAFQILSSPKKVMPAQVQAQLINNMAQAAGPKGMLGGQMLDILAEGQQKSANEIIDLELMKTGALLEYACTAGAILTEQSEQNIAIMHAFGSHIGFIFQLADDLLDSTSSRADLGKTPGKDLAAGKATFLSLYGEKHARLLLDQKVDEAQQILAPFGKKADILRQIAYYIAYRTY